MKLLFFHYSMQSSGAERTISLLSDYAACQGDTVTIVTMDDQPSFYALHPNVTRIRLKVQRYSKNPLQAIGSNLRSIQKIKAAYTTCQPDAVVCFGPNSILLSFLARGGMKYKLIGSERSNPYLAITGFWNKSKKWISTLCDGFLFQTEGARGYYPVATQNKAIVLPNSIVSADFATSDRPWEERRHLCAVGRMDVDKCFDDLLTAFAKVQARHPDVQLDLYGDGPLRTELEVLSVRLGLQSSAVFHGRCSTMLEEYATHKLFAMASRGEGMPNVLMEALASGYACVAADCDFGPSELIRDGENGFLVPIHDTDAMAGSLCHLLENDALCQRFSKSALSIRQTHDVETIGATFRAYLETL